MFNCIIPYYMSMSIGNTKIKAKILFIQITNKKIL